MSIIVIGESFQSVTSAFHQPIELEWQYNFDAIFPFGLYVVSGPHRAVPIAQMDFVQMEELVKLAIAVGALSIGGTEALTEPKEVLCTRMRCGKPNDPRAVVCWACGTVLPQPPQIMALEDTQP